MALEPHLVTTPIGDVTLWGDTTKLARFFPGVTTADVVDQAPVTVAVPSSSVSRYPGDPRPFTRRAHTRKVYPATARSNGTTPGRRFWCEIHTKNVLGETECDATQFTYQGTFAALKYAATTTAPMDFILRNYTGAGYDIEVANP